MSVDKFPHYNLDFINLDSLCLLVSLNKGLIYLVHFLKESTLSFCFIDYFCIGLLVSVLWT